MGSLKRGVSRAQSDIFFKDPNIYLGITPLSIYITNNVRVEGGKGWEKSYVVSKSRGGGILEILV